MIAPKCDKLFIRDIVLEDADAIAHYGSNERIARNQRDSYPFPITKDYAARWIKHLNSLDEASYFVVATEEQAIGMVGFLQQGDVYRYSAEISYWLGEEFWGYGIATWAVGLLIDHAFNEKGIKRLFAHVIEYNQGSKRVLEKCGFKQDGIMRRGMYKEEKFHDEYIYSLLFDDV